MYFFPGKMKTYTRTFNKVRASVFAEKQLSLFAAAGIREGVPRPYNNRGTRNNMLQNGGFKG